MPQTDKVPATPFRDACLQAVKQGTPLSTIAQEIGWSNRKKGKTDGRQGDVTRLERALGIRDCANPQRKRIKYETAVLLARALHKDPVDFDV